LTVSSGLDHNEEMELHPDVLKALQEKTDDVEKFVNDLLFVFLNDGLIRKSDVAGMVVTHRIYRKSVMVGSAIYEEITKEFKGVSVEGRVDGHSLFIPDERLHDLLEKNLVLLVMKSPREQGIRVEEANEIHATKHDLN
jgi:hypothetical protein